MDLNKLLAGAAPALHETEFVFCSVPRETAEAFAPSAVATFKENEGVTLILPRAVADSAGVEFTYPCRMITLTVHSALAAIGFMAKITASLAEHGISVNPVSAYYHDHLFVPADRAEEALAVLEKLSAQRS